MKIEVRMLTSMSGEPTCNYGDQIKVDPNVAARWEEKGICEIVRQAPRSKARKAVSKKAGKE